MKLTKVKYYGKKYYVGTEHYDNRIQYNDDSKTLCLRDKNGVSLLIPMVSINDLKVKKAKGV